MLTGDIVDSTKLTVGQRKKLIESLTVFFDMFKVKSKNNLQLKIPFELFRGDGFQGLVESPDKALLIALLIRAYLQGKVVFPKQAIKVDARIAIGIGKISYRADTLAESDGEAFQYAGRLLDGMKKLPNRIALKCSSAAKNDEMEASLQLLEGIMSRWTAAQAEVVYYKLQNHTEVTIAELLKVTQPTVSKHAKAAYWVAVDRLLKRYQTLFAPKIS